VKSVVLSLNRQPVAARIAHRNWRWLLLVVWLAQSGAAPGWAASLTASLDRNVVPVGENVTLTLRFDGVAPDSAPNLPALPGLTVLSVGQSQEFSIVNGQATSRHSFNYTLQANRTGDVVIPAMQINLRGTVLTSQALRLSITPAAAGGGAEAAVTNLAFLRLVVPKTEVYLGEPLPIEIHLYYQSARDIQMPQLKADGFSLGQAAKPAQTTTAVGGVAYNLILFKMSATPARVGTLSLGPAECQLTVLIPLNRPQRRRDSFFDPFFDFGPTAQPRPMTLASDGRAVKVLPLPTENVPPTFSGAVGTFQMNVTAGPNNLGVGDPLTVKVQISGQGRIEALALPDQPAWKDFKSYPPNVKVDSTDPLGLAGMKTFEQVLIPQSSDIKELPPFQFSYFDSGERRYRTLSGPAIPLTVRPSAGAAAPTLLLSTNAAADTPPPADDIIPVKTRLERIGRPVPLLAVQPWFLALQPIPVVVWLALLVWRRRADALANNPRLRRQREVARRVREGLKELHARAAARQPQGFFVQLFRLLQEQIGERLDLPASAITEAVIDERLRERRLSDATLTALHDLFQACNQARYAPVQTSQELEALIPRLESVLRELQDWKP
jgi:hypothetical protein